MTTVGPYPIVDVLGEGAYAVVYRVLDTESGQERALKWMRKPASRQERVRFQREVEISARLSHPNLVRQLAVGEFDGFAYILMEWIDGPPLSQVIAARPPGPCTAAWWQRVARLGTPLFDAVQCVHNHGIVHRDLKPQNIFVDADDRPHLGDFGLASELEAEVERSIVGSLTYMAPELLTGQEADRRSDMWSLGLILTELISGQLPYEGRNIVAAVKEVMKNGVRPLRELEAAAVPELEAVLARLCAFKPEDRYFTVAEACQDWLAALSRQRVAVPHGTLVPQVSAYSLMTPAFIGRDIELATLDRQLAAVRDGGAHVIIASGAPGGGKSRLLSQWLRGVNPRLSVLRGACRSRHDTPYQAFKRPFRDAFSASPADVQSDFGRLSELIFDVPDSGRLAELPLDSVPGVEQIRMHEEVRRFLCTLSQPGRPLIVAVDDAQWLDGPSLALLEALGDRWWFAPQMATHHPVLVVLTVRSEDVDSQSGLGQWLSRAMRRESASGHNVSAISIPLLTEPELTGLARSALGLGGRPLQADLAPVLVEEACGSPYLLLELLQTFLQEGLLRLDQGLWQWDSTGYRTWREQLSRGAVPSSLTRVQAFMYGRLGTLSDTERDVLQTCATAVGGFTFDEVVSASGVAERPVLDALDVFLSRGILQWRRVRYGFTHAMVLEMVRADLSESRRLQLHSRWSSTLLGEQEGAPELVFRLVEHCQETGQWADVTGLARQAAERLAHVYAYREAWELYRKLLQGEPTGDRLLLTLRAAELARLATDYDAASALLLPLVRSAEREQVLQRLGMVYWDKGDFDAAIGVWEELLSELGLQLSPSWRGGVTLAMGFLRSLDTRLADPRLPSDPAAAERVIETCDGIVHANYFRNNPSRRPLVLHSILTMMQVARKTGRVDWLSRAHTLFCYAATIQHPPRVRMARSLAAKAHAYVVQDGNPLLRAVVARDVSYMRFLMGDPSEASQILLEAETVARSCGDLNGLCWATDLRGFYETHLRDLPAVRTLLTESQQLCELLRHRRLGVSVRLRQSLCFMLLGDTEEAERVLDSPFSFETMTPFDDMTETLYRGILARLMRDPVGAATYLATAMEKVRKVQPGAFWLLLAGLHRGWALTDGRRACPDDVGDPLPDLQRLCRELRRAAGPQPFLAGPVKAVEAELAECEGQVARAVALLEQAIGLARLAKSGTYEAWFAERLARLAHRHQTPDAAARLDAAAAAWEAMGALKPAERLGRALAH